MSSSAVSPQQIGADTQALAVREQQVLDFRSRVTALKIVTADDFALAGLMLQSNTELLRQVAETFDPIIKKAHEAHKEAIKQKGKFSAPLEEDRRTLDKKMLSWSSEQERIRREKEAELAAEEQRKADEAALAEASDLERQGEHEQAAAVVQQQAIAPAPVVALPPTVPKVAGFAQKERWTWKVTNADLVPRQYLMVDEAAIGGVVRSLKNKTSIPGIKVWSESVAIHR